MLIPCEIMFPNCFLHYMPSLENYNIRKRAWGHPHAVLSDFLKKRALFDKERRLFLDSFRSLSKNPSFLPETQYISKGGKKKQV